MWGIRCWALLAAVRVCVCVCARVCGDGGWGGVSNGRSSSVGKAVFQSVCVSLNCSVPLPRRKRDEQVVSWLDSVLADAASLSAGTVSFISAIVCKAIIKANGVYFVSFKIWKQFCMCYFIVLMSSASIDNEQNNGNKENSLNVIKCEK